jgi:hypothetical protein
MQFYWLTLGVLAVWRLTHLLNAEDGPWDTVVRLRLWLAAGFWGRLLDCFYCLSLWIALPLALAIGEGWWERVLLWPAISGGAILLERLSRAAPPAALVEQITEGTSREDQDGMLRR